MSAFALRAKYFWQTGEYVFRTDDLKARLAPADACLLDGREAARALTDDASAFEALSERLLLWSGNAIRELSAANENDI